MRAALALLAALAALAAAPAAAEEIPVDGLAIEMDARDADVLFKKDPYDKSAFEVAVRTGEGPRDFVRGTIEVKGSFTRQTRKKSLLIKLDGGKWRGQSRISLNGMGTDPSMMREWLSWELMRALGMVVPHTRYTRLSINGADAGLFLRIEWIDAGLFERHKLGGDGELFHPSDSAFCGDLTPASLEPGRDCWLKLAPRDADFTALRTLVEEIAAQPVDSFHELVERRFDAESVVNWFAVNALVTETDTYNKNYFLYLSKKTGRWLVVPWDYDLTFGRAFDPDRPFPQTILNDHFHYYFPVEAGQSNPLHYQALKNATLRARVLARIRDLVTGGREAGRPWRGWFAQERMQVRLAQLHAVLRDELRRDPFMRDAAARFEDEVAAVRFYARARVQHLKQVVLRLGQGRVRDAAEGVVVGGRAGDLVDGWGHVLASVHLPAGAAAARVQARVARGWPELVPPGVDRASCLQRTWWVSGSDATTESLMLTWLDAGLRAREPGARVADERALALYARTPAGWAELPAEVAPVANLLTVGALRLSREPLRLVACVPPAGEAGAVAATP